VLAQHTFFWDWKSLPHSHPNLEFTNCISLTFDQQKWEEKNDTIIQQASGSSILCPVQLAARLERCIWAFPGTTEHISISTYMSNRDTLQVTSEQVIKALCDAIGAIGEVALGISKVKIGTHIHQFLVSHGNISGQMLGLHHHAHWPVVK
jgi:hypothetical protein